MKLRLKQVNSSFSVLHFKSMLKKQQLKISVCIHAPCKQIGTSVLCNQNDRTISKIYVNLDRPRFVKSDFLFLFISDRQLSLFTQDSPISPSWTVHFLQIRLLSLRPLLCTVVFAARVESKQKTVYAYMYYSILET